IGLTILQTAANPYVTILGPAESAAQRISFMGIANKVAGILGQYIMGGILLAGTAATSDDLGRVVNPYLVLTILLAGLAVLVLFSKLPDINAAEEPVAVGSVAKTSVWQFPHLLLGVLALFLYVGVEVISGDTIINYGLSQGFSQEVSKHFTTYTLYGMLTGYVLGIFAIPKYITQQKALQWSAILGVLLTLAALITTGFISVLCVALLGLANALMWPAIFPLAIAGLGKFTKIGSALLIMGIAGGALIPLVYGRLADSIGTQWAYAIALPCYLFILYFSVRGWKAK
ncbi:MAG: glucose/galactose MFS transporter, partial [Saprospiraceae bacterium]|nr:glucose/galactose MFS transporter [Saprospiraceae bacterium]